MGEVLSGLGGGFATAAQPYNLFLLFIACTLGLIIGVLPGLGGTSGVAILLPVSIFIASGGPGGPTSAVIFLAGIYWGALFGGVITSILFNIPGEPWAVALLFDGFPLAKRHGKPGVALTSSFVASFLGALIATIVGLDSGSPMKSVMMIAFGLLLAAVGFDTLTGAPRLTFGRIEMLSGIGFVPVTIGLFGIGEIIASAEESGIGYVEKISARLGFRDLLETLGALRSRILLVITNSIIGFWFGVLPGHGATAASFLGYGLARQYSKDKSKFGKGEISGIMGPQCAADAAGVGSRVPLRSEE